MFSSSTILSCDYLFWNFKSKVRPSPHFPIFRVFHLMQIVNSFLTKVTLSGLKTWHIPDTDQDTCNQSEERKFSERFGTEMLTENYTSYSRTTMKLHYSVFWEPLEGTLKRGAFYAPFVKYVKTFLGEFWPNFCIRGLGIKIT